jgi:hypothetical protein
MNYELPKLQNLYKPDGFDASKPFVWAASGDNGLKAPDKISTDVIAVNIPSVLIDGYSDAMKKIVWACFTRYAQNAIQTERRDIIKAVEGASFQNVADNLADQFIDWANSVKPEATVKAPKVLTARSMAIEDVAQGVMKHKPGTKIADARKRAVEFHEAGNTKIWVAALKDAEKRFAKLQVVPEGEEY